jgi:uncharacterized membrane protein
LHLEPPRVERALRYAMRGRFRNIIARHHFNARIDELFAQIAPDGDEYAAILRHAQEIAAAMERELVAS